MVELIHCYNYVDVLVKYLSIYKMKRNLIKDLNLFKIMPKKINMENNERNIIIQEIFKILGLTEKNNEFSLNFIDKNEEIINSIIKLDDQIKKNFVCSHWSCFKHPDTIKRKWLSMIKYIFKDMNHKLVPLQKKEKINSKYIHSDIIYKLISE